jgi:hypothetical protein
VEFVRTVARGISDAEDVVDNDPGATFEALSHVCIDADAKLNDQLASLSKLALDSGDATTSLGRFVASADRLAQVAKNSAESYRTALEGDRNGDEQRKQTFRAYAQQALFDSATNVLVTEDYVAALGREWKVVVDLHYPLPPKDHSAVSDVSKGSQSRNSDSVDSSDDSQEQGQVVDLLPLIDTEKGAAWGLWQKTENVLKSDAGLCSRIEVSYEPPAEYDYKVVFERHSGNDDISLICYANAHQFSWNMGAGGNTAAGFSYIRSDNPTVVHFDQLLINGQKYTCIVKVRRSGVQAYLDDKLISELKGDYADLAPDPNAVVAHKNTLGLLSYASPTTFYKVEVKEISGQGKIIDH